MKNLIAHRKGEIRLAKVAFHTLGCKVNQYETRTMLEAFLRAGFDVVDFADRADVYIINSCTVTSTADAKSRHAARNAWHRSPEALVVLAGCFAETSPDAAQALEGVSLALGNRDKSDILARVLDRLSPELAATLDPGRGELMRPGRTRATIKIQDGCDQFCSYCIVPFARPVLHSRPSDEVRSEIVDLVSRGFKEIVLAGIRLGRYADDDGTNLTGIVRMAAETPGIERVRLSSIELTDIPKGLIEYMAEDRRVCRHLPLPLQSGDAEVLKRMNRPYTPEEFAAFVENVRACIPGIGVTTDIMVGFPGETDEEFESSRSFVEGIRFSRAHVFRYSARPGTAASKLADDVSAAEKDRRSKTLIRLAERHAAEFACGIIGTVSPVLVEGKHLDGGLFGGLTDNYVRVEFEAEEHLIGEIVGVRIDAVCRGRVTGTVYVPG